MVTSSARRFSLASPAALLAVLVSVGPGYAKCDPSTDPDKSDIANARAAVAANCDCVGALTHGAYVKCAVQQANTVLINPSCKGAVKKCAAHSTCGKPTAVTCCLTTTKGTKCKIKKDAAHCAAKQGTAGSCTSCCDACPAPGSGPSCPAPTTTTTTVASTTTTTTTMPTGPCQCGTPDPTRLQFTTAVGTGNCGVATKSDGTTALNLACGVLYVGGGSNVVPPPFAVPDMSTSLTKVAACSGTGLTLGNLTSTDTGSNRNCTSVGCLFGPPLPMPNAGNSPYSVCVINLVASNATGTADCSSGAASISLPLASTVYIDGDLFPKSGGVDHCVGGANPGTVCTMNSQCTGGGFCSVGVQACPICAGDGLCHGGDNDGAACTPADSALNSNFPTSQDCPPPSGNSIGSLPIAFALTTGSTSRTAATISGQSNVFCGFCRDGAGTLCFEGDPNTSCPHNAGCTGGGAPYPCCTGAGAGSCDPQAVTACTSAAQCTNAGFPDCQQRDSGAFGLAGRSARTITETGVPGGAISDRAAHASTLISIFCIPPTFNAGVDLGFDWPGPGAVSLPGTAQLLP